eukprot:185094_1
MIQFEFSCVLPILYGLVFCVLLLSNSNCFSFNTVVLVYDVYEVFYLPILCLFLFFFVLFFSHGKGEIIFLSIIYSFYCTGAMFLYMFLMLQLKCLETWMF